MSSLKYLILVTVEPFISLLPFIMQTRDITIQKWPTQIVISSLHTFQAPSL